MNPKNSSTTDVEELTDLKSESPLRFSVRVEKLFHREKHCLALYFPNDNELKRLVKTIPGAAFSWTHRCWYIENRENLLSEIFVAFKRNAWVDITGLKTNEQPPELHHAPKKIQEILPDDHVQALRMMEQELKLRGYSDNTRPMYLQMFKNFLQFYALQNPIDLSEIEIRNYVLYLVEKKKVGRSYQNACISAIKFFYEKVLGQERKVYHLERPLKEVGRVGVKVEIPLFNS